MPNIENLEKKPFINSRDNLLNVRRGEILYREDLTTGFVFVVVGTTISLAVAGTIYVVVLGISIAYFVDQTGIVQKLSTKLFTKKE
ncbi:13384_t:CDS:2, partial [Entrophospora sp. SA101]